MRYGPPPAPEPAGHPTDPLSPLAERLRAGVPRCGRVRLVAVDGHAGSGKTTLAAHLAGRLAAPVLHLDDLASHTDPFDWTRRLREQVLAPLARGEAARYEVYDWERRAFASTALLPAASLVLVEGVGAGRRALRPSLTALIWLDVPAAGSWARGRRRDGPGLSEFWDGWISSETAHFSSDPSRPYADFLVRQGLKGYQVREGPGSA